MPEMEAFPYYMIKAACNYKQACISFFDNQGVQIFVILVLVVRFNSFSNVKGPKFSNTIVLTIHGQVHFALKIK